MAWDWLKDPGPSAVIEFWIPGQLRSGKNNMRVARNGVHYPAPGWKAWRDEIVSLLRLKKFEMITRPAIFEVHCFHGDRRRRDISGMMDAIFHIVERAGMIKDDSLFWEASWKTEFSPYPGAAVRLIPLSEEAIWKYK